MLIRIISLGYLMSQGCLFLQRSVCDFNGKKTPTNAQTIKHQTAKICWQLNSRELWTHMTPDLFDVFKALRFSSEYIQNSAVSTRKSFNRVIFWTSCLNGNTHSLHGRKSRAADFRETWHTSLPLFQSCPLHNVTLDFSKLRWRKED